MKKPGTKVAGSKVVQLICWYINSYFNAKTRSTSSLTGRASISARRVITDPPFLPQSIPTTPVWATSVCTSRPGFLRCSAISFEVRNSQSPSPGFLWMSLCHSITLLSSFKHKLSIFFQRRSYEELYLMMHGILLYCTSLIIRRQYGKYISPESKVRCKLESHQICHLDVAHFFLFDEIIHNHSSAKNELSDYIWPA